MLVLWFAARHPDRLTLLVALALLALAFFAVPTRVHERYGFPFFAIGAILFAVSSRWRWAYVTLSVATFLNISQNRYGARAVGSVCPTAAFAFPYVKLLPVPLPEVPDI